MSPGKRKKNKGWEKGLHRNQYGAFYFIRPDLLKGANGRIINFGKVDFHEANEAARQLNQELRPGGRLAQNILAAIQPTSQEESVETIGDYVNKMKVEVFPNRRINGHPMSHRTIDAYSITLGNIERRLGTHELQSLPQSEIANYLNSCGKNDTQPTAEVYNKHRSLLVMMYKVAISEGLDIRNLPENILPRDKEPKQRKQFMLPGDKPGQFGIDGKKAYLEIFNAADWPTKCAMELAVNTMQRREEIHRWKRDWSYEDHDGRHVYIKINKTHKHGSDSYIRVPESMPTILSGFDCKTLGELISHCFKDELICPHLVHRKPEKYRKSKEKSTHSSYAPKPLVKRLPRPETLRVYIASCPTMRSQPFIN